MNFLDDPSEYYYTKKYFSNNRYNNCVYKELSKTSTYSHYFGRLMEAFAVIFLNESLNIFIKLLESGVNHFDLKQL